MASLLPTPRLPERTEGLTLLELMTVIVIMSILLVMLVPVISGIKGRMEKANCTSTMRGIHVAASAYLTDHKMWPQVDAGLLSHDSEEYARQWIAEFAPYGLTEKEWHCPTVERLSDSKRKHGESPKLHIDYIATPFDSREMTPRLWTRQPWFVERGNVHGNGNLMIFMDGSVIELAEFLRTPVN